jgi:hypothetical protein
METVRSEGEDIEPLLPWLWQNVLRLAFYLLIASIVSAVLFMVPDPAFEAGDVVFLTLALFAGGGLYCLPGTAIWLVILSRLSPDVPIRRRKVIAILTAPLLVGLVWIVLLWSLIPVLAGWFGVILPAGAGLVVRLRERSRAPLLDLAF